MEPSDAELFGRYRERGDVQALAELYDRCAPELLRVALHLCGDPASAEDALQATFVTAIERAERYDAGRPLRPWLAGILANRARQARARAAARVPEGTAVEQVAADDPRLDAERAELLERLDGALGQLPAEWRPVLSLRLRHGLSASEIACALERPPGTVRSQLQRGTEALRRALPASLAGSALLALADTARGLEGVRAAVLAHATLAAAPITATAAVGGTVGVLLMKKTLLAAALVVAASLAVVLATRPPEGAAPLAAEPERTDQLPVAPQERADRTPTDADAPADALVPTVRTERVAATTELEDAAAPAATTGAIEVRVLWADTRRPAEGCVVFTRNYSRGIGFPQEVVARTDADGLARLERVDPGFVSLNLLRGAPTQVLVVAGETSTAELELPVGVEVTGEVVDELGRGVGGAGLWLSDGSRVNEGHVVARADAAGRFTLRSVRSDQYIGARAVGFAPSYVVDPPGAPGDRVELRLVLSSRSAPVVGRVLDGDGEPIADASVLVGSEEVRYDHRLENGMSTPGSPPSRVSTDPEGAFHAELAPLGAQPVQVRAPGYGPWTGTVEVLPQVGAELEVRLVRAASVVGRTLGPDGEPLSQVRVQTVGTSAFGAAQCWSSRKGEFRLPGLAPGEVRLLARHPDHGRCEVELELAPGEQRSWEAQLVPSLRVFGRVSDELDRPLAGWTLALFDPKQPPPNWRGDTTDGEGRFSMEGLEQRDYVLTLNRAGGLHEFARLRLSGVRPGTEPLELRVDSSGRDVVRLRGVVVGPGGVPVSGVWVGVAHMEQNLWRRFEPDGDTGEFAFEAPPGTLRVELRSEDHPWLKLEPRAFEAGQETDLGTLELPTSGRLRGQIEGLDDAQLATLALALSHDHREAGVLTLQGREFKSGPLAPGSYTLRARAEFARSLRLEVEITDGGEQPLVLRFERAALREVHVTRREPFEGRPPWTWCALLDASGRTVWVQGNLPWVDSAWVARISAAPGTYRVVARDIEGNAAEAEIVITSLNGTQPPLPLLLVPEGD